MYAQPPPNTLGDVVCRRTDVAALQQYRDAVLPGRIETVYYTVGSRRYNLMWGGWLAVDPPSARDLRCLGLLGPC